MGLLDSKQQSAAAIVLLLGVAIVIALSPYVTGLVGIPVLYAVFAPVQQWLARRMREQLAAILVVALALFLIVVPGVSFAGLVVAQAQQIAGSVVRNPILGRLAQLQIAGVDLGPRIADLGAQVVSWIGSSAFGLIGTATARPEPDDLPVRLVLPAAPARADLGSRATLHPLLRQERREAAAAVSRRDDLDDHRHRPDRRGPGTARRRGILDRPPPQRGVLGRGHDGLRHPPRRGQRPGVGTGRDRAAARPSPRCRAVARPDLHRRRGERRLRHPTDGVPALGAHSPAGDAGG